MATRSWKKRGRVSSHMLSYHDRRILDQLAKIAVKYEMESTEFFQCLINAWKNKESKCKQLNIVCREKRKDGTVFLFKGNQKIIAQFPVSNQILRGTNQLDLYIKTIQDQKAKSLSEKYNPTPKIGELKAGMKRINLEAKVVEIPKSIMVYTRYGNTANVANALISDETGSIRMSLWNQQITMIKKGDRLRIENGKVTKFKGELQIRIGKHGSLSVI